MGILRHIIIIIIATLLTGCYENFSPEVDTEPVLCLNSLIKAGEPIEVKVSHTWMFNDPKAGNNHDVADAKISIFANDKSVDSSYIPVEGDKIRIMADSPVYGTAMAEVVVPYATPIGKVKVSPAVRSIWKGGEDFADYQMFADITFSLNIEMDVNDQANVENYYRFEYNWYSSGIDSDYSEDGDATKLSSLAIGQMDYNAEPIFKEHVGVFESVMGNGEDTHFVFFTDRQFPGDIYTLHINFPDNVFRVESKVYDESLLECGVNLYLTTVSKSYYNWAVYKWNVDEGVIGDFSDIGFADPKWGYSNVSTGAGVVAAQSTSCYTIDLTDFVKTAIYDN